MVHRSRTVHATAAAVWLPVALLALLGVVPGGADLHAVVAFPGATGALFGSLAAATLVGRAERAPAAAGLRLAAEGRTRRAVLRRSASRRWSSCRRRPRSPASGGRCRCWR